MDDDRYRDFKMMIDLPYLKKGKVYYTDYETAEIYGYESDGNVMTIPLRNGLSGYIWLLIASNNKRLIKEV